MLLFGLGNLANALICFKKIVHQVFIPCRGHFGMGEI